MSPEDPARSLQKLFESSLDSDEIEEILAAFEKVAPKLKNPALNIGLILSDFSKKAAAAYFKVLPEVLSSISPDELGPWVGMGIKIAQKSAASGIRFFKEGPAVFSEIKEAPLRQRFIRVGLALADADINLAVEYYRRAPRLLAHVPLSEDEFSDWVLHGRLLGQIDYTLAIEYFKITPEVLLNLPIRLVPKWLAVGKRLSQREILPTLHYMRNSPEVFSRLTSEAIQELLLKLANAVAEDYPLLAGQLFSDAPGILIPFQALHLESALLEKSLEISAFDGDLAANLFLNGPKVLKALSDIAPQFSDWVDEGIALIKQSPSAAKAFFLLSGTSGQTAMDRLRGGVSLASISRTLKIFAEALSGKAVSIQPTTKLQSSGDQDDLNGAGEMPITDGQTIFLPAHISLFPDNALNFEWYKVATAYQAAYLEFNTFYPQMNETAELIEGLQARYGQRGGFSSLDSFFQLFPEPQLIQRLFEIAEGARVEFFLRREYPGLRKPMIRMREADLGRRPSLVGLTPRGVILELLFQISLAGKTKEPVPNVLEKIFLDLCRFLGIVQDPAATVATAMKAATQAYDYLDEGPDLPEEVPDKEMEAFEEAGTRTKGKSEERGEIQPSARGAIDPKRVEAARKVKQEYSDKLLEKLKEAGLDLSSEAVDSAISKSVSQGDVRLEVLQEGASMASLDRLAEQLKSEHGKGGSGGARAFFYDEWNCEETLYRQAWCQVREREVALGSLETVEAILSEYRGMIHSITTAFQMLRPEGLIRMKGAREGDCLDLDALISAHIEMKAGRSPSEGIYISRQKKERSVAVAFLVDMSGSTQQQLPDQNKSILQTEKEALLLMAKAVEAIGDAFALYGFSGRGKDGVDFHLLKEFEEAYTPLIDRRIGQIEPGIQNRDGAAIRHAASKLAAQPAKIRILILMSDGRPLDDGYRGSYATADTKMALQETKRLGIHPYCITVDREGPEYLKGMYGDVAYMVIDQVEKLPIRLPQIYKRLTT